MHTRSLPYIELQELVQSLGGEMKHRPVGRGVVWEIDLWGKLAEVAVPDGTVNALDDCYEPPTGNPNPTHWSDWDGESEFRLKPDARFRVVNLVQRHAK